MSHRGILNYPFLIALMLVQALPVVFAQSATVDTSVDRYTINIGEPIHYVISVRYPEKVDVSPVIDASLDDFEILDSGTDSRIESNEVVFERWYKLTAFKYGGQTIPEPIVSFNDTSGGLQEVRGDAITFTVQRLLAEDWQSEDIREVKPLVPITNLWWLWIAIVFVGFVSALLFWMRKRQKLIVSNIEPPRPAHEIALEALDNLHKDDLLSQGMYEDYYVRVSNINRAYVEARFALRAPDMTTEEFLKAAVQNSSISEAHRTLLQNFLHHCDLVKFARYQPSVQEAGEVMDSARRFIEETTVEMHEIADHPSPLKKA